MTWLDALILGVVQGLTEFFPVSSSGHLVISQRLLGLEVPGMTFDIAVHVATLISVLVVYRDRVWALIRGAFGGAEESTWPYLGKLVLATIPAVIVGFTLKDWFEQRFDDPIFAGTMILVTGCVVWSSRWARAERRPPGGDFVPLVVAAALALLAGTVVPFLAVLAAEALLMAVSRLTAREAAWVAEPRWGGALMMGLAQALAILPGISRSGSTVIAGLWRRVDAVAAAEFSFLMSIPVILGAAVLDFPDALQQPDQAIAAGPLLVGFTAAAVAGVVAIRFFVALLRRQNFHVFAWYCWAAAGIFLLVARFGT